MTRGAREVSIVADSAAPYMVFQFYYGARPVEAATRKLCTGDRLLVIGWWWPVAHNASVAGHPTVRTISSSSGSGRSMNRSHRSKRLLFAIARVFAWPAALPAQVTVLMSGGFSAAYQELLPQFEKSTGITVSTAQGASQGDGPTTIGAQLRRGVPADVVILSREGLAELLAEGRIVIGSDVDLASVPLGVGVRAGTLRPDISTVDAFRQTLLRAKSIGIQSTSAIY